MPDPNTTLAASMSSAPGADIPFDELFPNEGDHAAAQTSATEATPQNQPQAPEFFLKAGKSVYKTSEDAAQGVAHKDQLIDRYRSYLQEQNIDPDTLQTKPKPSVQDPNDPYRYFGKEGKIFDDLSDALTRRDKAGYDKVLDRAFDERLDSRLGPLAPLIAEISQQRAVRQVSEQAKDFSTFRYSEDFNTVRRSIPLLDNAIKAAESDYRMSDQLPDLYRMVYLIHQGGAKPESAAPTVQTTVQTSPSVRPTMASSTMTPPPPGVNTQNWATNSDSRKQLIKDFENRGIQDKPF